MFIITSSLCHHHHRRHRWLYITYVTRLVNCMIILEQYSYSFSSRLQKDYQKSSDLLQRQKTLILECKLTNRFLFLSLTTSSTTVLLQYNQDPNKQCLFKPLLDRLLTCYQFIFMVYYTSIMLILTLLIFFVLFTNQFF